MPETNTQAAESLGGKIGSEQLRKTRKRLAEQFFKQAQPSGDAAADAIERKKIEAELPNAMRAADASLAEDVRTELLRAVIDELYGFGPIQPLLDDPTITEVMVNRVDRVYVERNGKPMRTDIRFDDEDHVRQIIDRIIRPLGKKLDASSPLVDA